MSKDRRTESFRFLDFFRDSWRGDERLPVVFWCGGFATLCVTLASFFLALIGGMLFLGPVAMIFPVSPGRAFEIVAAIFFLSGFGVSALWWLVSVWRCAPNARRRLWFFAARGVVLCDAAAAGLVLLV
ncbi:MAG TPA: hypothetical protein VLA33_00200 [Gemmatimonadota bacterium]|nr:hypothetical protein [Gemmatimonadota bacterium]